MIIGLVGEKLSGKDTAAQYLVKQYQAYHIRYSDTLDEILKVLDLAISRRNEIDLGLALRSGFGKGVLNHSISKKVRESTTPHSVINGIRFVDELTTAEQLGAKIIYITAPIETRYQRYLHRKEKSDDGSQTLEQFQHQESEKTEMAIAGLGAQASFRIDNDSDLESLYHELDKLIKNS